MGGTYHVDDEAEDHGHDRAAVDTEEDIDDEDVDSRMEDIRTCEHKGQ